MSLEERRGPASYDELNGTPGMLEDNVAAERQREEKLLLFWPFQELVWNRFSASCMS